MKKTLFLSAILATALCSSAFAETLTLTANTAYSSVSAEYDAIDLAGFTLTVVAGENVTQTLSGSGTSTITGSGTVSGDASAFTGIVNVADGQNLTIGEVGADRVSLTGSSSLEFTAAINLPAASYNGTQHGYDGMQKWGDNSTATYKLTGENTTKGLCVIGDSSILRLEKATDAESAILNVTNGLYIANKTNGKLVAADGVTLKATTASLSFGGGAIVSGDNNEAATGGALKAFFSGALSAEQGGLIELTGNINAVDTGINGRTETVTAGFGNMKINGNVTVSTWSNNGSGQTTTWALDNDDLYVTGDLHLRNRQYMTVDGTSSSLKVDGKLKLAHNLNNDDGAYRAGVTVTNGATLTLGGVYLYANYNTLDVNGGEVKFVTNNANTNVLSGTGNVDNCAFTFNNATLNAESGGWTLNALGRMGLTVSGDTLLKASGKTITLGVANTTIGHVDISGNIKGNGTLTLGYARLNGNLSFAGAPDGTATGNGTMVVNMNTGLSKKADIDPVALTIGGGLTFNLDAVSTDIINSVSVSGASRLNIKQTATLSSTTLAGTNTVLDVQAASTLGALSGEGKVWSSTSTQKIVTIGSNGENASFTGSLSLGTTTLKKTGSNAQTITLNANSTIGHLDVESGSLSFNLNNKTLTTPDALSLTLGSGAELTLGTADSHNNDLTTTTLTVNGNSTLNANLVVADGGTLDFSSGAILTMGCDVTINGSEVTVVIDSGELASIQHGTELTLITDIENLNLNEAITVHFKGENNQSLDGYGLRLEKGKDGISLVVTPEPATATLSLLALAGLAARRRRH